MEVTQLCIVQMPLEKLRQSLGLRKIPFERMDLIERGGTQVLEDLTNGIQLTVVTS